MGHIFDLWKMKRGRSDALHDRLSSKEKDSFMLELCRKAAERLRSSNRGRARAGLGARGQKQECRGRGMHRRAGQEAKQVYLVNILHDILAAGFQIGNEGSAVTDGLEIIQCQGNIHCMSHGQQMKNCVGAAAKCHNSSDGVFERFPCHDVPWLDVPFQKLQQCTASI